MHPFKFAKNSFLTSRKFPIDTYQCHVVGIRVYQNQKEVFELPYGQVRRLFYAPHQVMEKVVLAAVEEDGAVNGNKIKELACQYRERCVVNDRQWYMVGKASVCHLDPKGSILKVQDISISQPCLEFHVDGHNLRYYFSQLEFMKLQKSQFKGVEELAEEVIGSLKERAVTDGYLGEKVVSRTTIS